MSGHAWEPHHLAAGYHEQEWEVPTKRSQLVGTYAGVEDGKPITLEVRWLPEGPTGMPEMEIEWDNGRKVTVLDEATAVEYLLAYGAATIES